MTESTAAVHQVRFGTSTGRIVLAVTIVASGMGTARPDWLDEWKRWPDLAANIHDNLFFIPPDIMQRHTPRILDGASQLCEQLESVRAKRGDGPPASTTAKD